MSVVVRLEHKLNRWTRLTEELTANTLFHVDDGIVRFDTSTTAPVNIRDGTPWQVGDKVILEKGLPVWYLAETRRGAFIYMAV